MAADGQVWELSGTRPGAGKVVGPDVLLLGTKFGAVNHHKDRQPAMPEVEVTNGNLSAHLFFNRKVNEIKIEFVSHSYKS
ncbi:hypothetical protein NC652_015737 [Populus alba x Populus x berolinensis]|nr:hypothetical protein NC652_015737 [Populus alba x Populus x berolinensis]